MEQPGTPVSHKRRAKFVIGAGVVLLTLIGLVVWAMNRPGSTSFYRTTSEIQALGESVSATSDYRVNGKVVPGSIDREGLTTTFELTDGATEITVVTEAEIPDTFRDESDVVAKGYYSSGTFTASEILAKCPSKFKAKA